MAKYTILIVIFLIMILPFSQTMAASDDICAEMKEADQRLNAAYQTVMHSEKIDAQAKNAIKKAQRAWIAFRDAHVESIFPGENLVQKYGTAYKLCTCITIQKLTEDRIQQLKFWIDGVQEGDVCSGSSFTKK